MTQENKQINISINTSFKTGQEIDQLLLKDYILEKLENLEYLSQDFEIEIVEMAKVLNNETE